MKQEYKLTVAMGPVPTLVMDLFTMQPFWPNVSWVDDGGLKTYVAQSDIERLRTRGLEDFNNAVATKKVIGRIQKSGQAFIDFVDSFDYESEITAADINEFLDSSSAFLVQYSEFSELLFEEVYRQSDSNKNFIASLKLIEESKNSLREQLNAALFEPENQFERFLGILATQVDVSVDDLYWYRGSELASVIQREVVAQDELGARKVAFVHEVFADKPTTFHSGTKAQEFIFTFTKEQLTSHTDTDAKAIKGIVAFKTDEVVMGAVCKIEADLDNLDRTNEHMECMKEGSILVAQQTAPELLPAMKKASAIVTDIGGLLSHAAITSRELGIPCIVGTGNATQVLKDGDKVAVDTENGEVRRCG